MKYIVTFLFLPCMLFSQLNVDVMETRVFAERDFELNSATLQIVLQNGQNEITRPLVVAEGFDPGMITSPENCLGDTNIISFVGDVQDGGFNLRNLIDPTFNARDYDLIYVNWDNGVAALQDNSEVLEAVINWVNENKVENAAPNVLLGQSMGGVLGRYTLARMEQEQPGTNPHDVALFIAHDAPMQGANTPIGIQHFTRNIYNQYVNTPAEGLAEVVLPVALGLAELIADATNRNLNTNFTVLMSPSPNDVLTLQDTPAAVQLNYEWVNFNEQVSTSLHDAWQQELESFDYPALSRNIAISNGNECAADHGFAAGDRLINIDTESNPEFLADLATLFYVPLIGVAIADIGLTILSAIPGNSKFDFVFDIHSNNPGYRVYYGRISYEKKLLWLVPVRHTITSQSKDSPSSSLPYETFSGGFFGLDGVLDEQIPFRDRINLLQDSYGFIPVVSALDIKRNNVKVNEADYRIQYAGGTTPELALTTEFNNFIVDFQPNNAAGNLNFQHISFQPRNGDWLAAELLALDDPNQNPDIADCSFVCVNLEILGQAILCTEDTYSVDIAGDATMQWDTNPRGIIEATCPTCPTTSFRSLGNHNRDVTIIARISSIDCDVTNEPIERTIRVGRPDRPNSISGPTVVNSGALVTYIGSPANGATSYLWRLPYPYQTVQVYDYFGQDWQMMDNTTFANHEAFTGYRGDDGYVQLIGVNRCGNGGGKLLYVSHHSTGGGNGGGPSPGGPIPLVGDPSTYKPSTGVAMFPNPAAFDINFAIVPVTVTDEEQPTTIYRVLIYDQTYTGIVDYSYGNEGTQLGNFPVPDVADGTYLAVIATDIGYVTKNLIIRR